MRHKYGGDCDCNHCLRRNNPSTPKPKILVKVTLDKVTPPATNSISSIIERAKETGEDIHKGWSREEWRDWLTPEEIEKVREFIKIKFQGRYHQYGWPYDHQIRWWAWEFQWHYTKDAKASAWIRQMKLEIAKWTKEKIGPEVRLQFAINGTAAVPRKLRLDEMDMIPWWEGRKW